MRAASTVLILMLAAGSLPAAPLDLRLGQNGEVRLGGQGVRIAPVIRTEGWKTVLTGVPGEAALADPAGGKAQFDFMDGGKVAHGTAELRQTDNVRATLRVDLTASRDQTPEVVALTFVFPEKAFAGTRWRDGAGADILFPETGGGENVYSGRTESFELLTAVGGERFRIGFSRPTKICVLDERKWKMHRLVLQIRADAEKRFRTGEARTFACEISSSSGVRVSVDGPVTVSRGKDWIPLDDRKDIVAGSALDFSGMGLRDAPAGKHGWLRNVAGHFEFENLPGRPQRFYGVNLCYGACYPEGDDAERLVTRLVRLGYNAIRLHHYESANGIVRGAADGLSLDGERMRCFDRLVAAAISNGVYLTTDLFTSRPVRWRDIGIGRDGRVDQQAYKALLGVHEPAFENWRKFAANFMTHVNEFTQRRYADEPALPIVCVVNEGNFVWSWRKFRDFPPMKAAWKEWLGRRRKADPAFARGVSDDSSRIDGRDNAVLVLFAADVEERLFRRASAFLRSIGVKAMLTSQNCGPHSAPLAAVREKAYDYVDDHFYVDHPEFLGADWGLPSKCPNGNPVKYAFFAPVRAAFTRMAGKPFCVSEWNFCGPGACRGIGGIMAGALGAVQDWDGMWRFDYAYRMSDVFDGSGTPRYFDLATDPLALASDRACICLFLRRDMPASDASLTLSLSPEAFLPASGKATEIVPEWHEVAWQMRVATGGKTASPSERAFDLLATGRAKRPPVTPAENRRVRLDRARGSFTVSTGRTAGGFVPSGRLDAGAVSFDVGEDPATVWVSSLDGRPIAESERLLVSHLTDVQADGNVYSDRTKTVLVKWGKTPVVRKGRARVSIDRVRSSPCAVWALGTNGTRLERIPAKVGDGKLSFVANVAGTQGARLLYEVVVQGK